MEAAITTLRLTPRGTKRAEKFRNELSDIVVGWESGEDGVEIDTQENFINVLTTDKSAVAQVVAIIGPSEVLETTVWRPRTPPGYGSPSERGKRKRR
jgi:hypothetical protein